MCIPFLGVYKIIHQPVIRLFRSSPVSEKSPSVQVPVVLTVPGFKIAEDSALFERFQPAKERLFSFMRLNQLWAEL